MITEDYVSFETAKLLKEKGFNEPTTKSYYTEGFENPMIFPHDLLPCIQTDEFLCPTLQMAMKWLMKVHNIFVTITMYLKEGIELFHYELLEPYDNHIDTLYSEDGLRTYEEACEAAIKYCLENLI